MPRTLAPLAFLIAAMVFAGVQAPAAPAAQEAEDAWVKLCTKNVQTGNKKVCLVNHEGLDPNTGGVLIAAAVRKVEGEDKQQLLVRVLTAYGLAIQIRMRCDAWAAH